MSLVLRVAISRRDKQRKEAAHHYLTRRDEAVVAAWHKQLETEIAAKSAHQCHRSSPDHVSDCCPA